MFYAHKGQSSDNAFTTLNGYHTRTFYAFKTKAEREAEREKIWKESNGSQNLIDCTRAFVAQYEGSKFYVSPSGEVFASYDAYQEALEYAEMRFNS